jgi:asparagine synthase (glutamine-hydrolysing)
MHMSGFAGFTGNKPGVAEEMIKRIIHRGPDAQGVFAADGVSMGFCYLGEPQPVNSTDGRFAIVFNGIIYNKPTKPDTEPLADTEYLLELYAEYGEHMLNMLRGSFAFVIYDKDKAEVFAARDHFGIKPFYYGIFGNELIFASEIKAFLAHPDFEKEINLTALSFYLSFQYSVMDESMFKGVYKLPPAHFFRYNFANVPEGTDEEEAKNKKVKPIRYWQAEFNIPKAKPIPKRFVKRKERDKVLREIVGKIDTVLGESIATHVGTDDSIGSFLSGGVDSGLIASRFGGYSTFTVGFDYAGYNEISYAEGLSKDLSIANYNKLITTAEFWASLNEIQYHMDEPLADPSAVALYFASRLASERVKTVLSGEGADEFFGGYNIYQEPLALKPITILPMFLRRRLGALVAKLPPFWGLNFIRRGCMDVKERFIGGAKVFSEAERLEILKNTDFKGSGSIAGSNKEITMPFYDRAKDYDDIAKMQFLDIHLWLSGDILLKADKMAMAHSLEVRMPYLDREVFALAATLPTKFKVNRKTTKYAFRLAASRHLKLSRADKKKLGFPVPIKLWLRDDAYYAKVKIAFSSEAAAQFFHADKLIDLLDKHRLGKAEHSRKIWVIYTFLLWHEQFFGA